MFLRKKSAFHTCTPGTTHFDWFFVKSMFRLYMSNDTIANMLRWQNWQSTHRTFMRPVWVSKVFETSKWLNGTPVHPTGHHVLRNWSCVVRKFGPNAPLSVRHYRYGLKFLTNRSLRVSQAVGRVEGVFLLSTHIQQEPTEGSRKSTMKNGSALSIPRDTDDKRQLISRLKEPSPLVCQCHANGIRIKCRSLDNVHYSFKRQSAFYLS